MKSAKLEWALNDLNQSIKLLNEAIAVFPDFPKLWMMIGQIHEQKKDISGAFDAYNAGVNVYLSIPRQTIPSDWNFYFLD